MVHYSGEKGIDDGAIRMEFLTDILPEIKSTVFPTDNPRDSMLENVCSGVIKVENVDNILCAKMAIIS